MLPPKGLQERCIPEDTFDIFSLIYGMVQTSLDDLDSEFGSQTWAVARLPEIFSELRNSNREIVGDCPVRLLQLCLGWMWDHLCCARALLVELNVDAIRGVTDHEHVVLAVLILRHPAWTFFFGFPAQVRLTSFR